jgi:hypothetical protein
LARNDRLITLSWNVTITKAGTDGTWLAGTKMSANPAGLSVSDYGVSGVTLVDPVNSKRYLVARSGGSREGQPLRLLDRVLGPAGWQCHVALCDVHRAVS